MTTYTNKSLPSINKQNMITIVLSSQNKFDQADNKVLEEILKLSNDFSKIDSELSMTKQVSSLLSHKLVNMDHLLPR